jgi:hypothetical protein
VRPYATVASMRNSWRKPFVAYGARSLQASGLPADDYLKVPAMGLPYDQNALAMVGGRTRRIQLTP